MSEVLWADESTSISRKSLRQTLWHLQSAFKEFDDPSGLELSIEEGWIHIKRPTNFWLDTAEFEQVLDTVNHKPVCLGKNVLH